MSTNSLTLTLDTEEATRELASQFAQFLSAGDVLLLSGPIGAGKTAFARALITALLAAPEDIPSPTFTLVQTYSPPSFEIWHADLYRLFQPEEVIELGLVEAFDTALCLIEWPDRLGDLAPPSALSLTFQTTTTEGERSVSISWTTSKWTSILGRLST